MPRPNLFLIGAAKAGTTSLARFLAGLPGVALSPIKEPCHFCPDINAETAAEQHRQTRLRLDRYLAADIRPPLHLHPVPRRADYERLFDGTEKAQLRGECSTRYLPSRVAARAIHAYAPDARILVLLREPAARILSHYLMDWRTGVERRSLEACLCEEIALGSAARFSNCRMYLAQTDYAPMLARYRALFPAAQLGVYRFEDLVSDPDRNLSDLLRFLGIEHPSGALSLPMENASGQTARRPALDRALYLTGAKRHLERLVPLCLPLSWRRGLKRLYFTDTAHVAEQAGEAWRHLPEVRGLVEAYPMPETVVSRPVPALRQAG
ncbi:sulfotransferase family protein [Histidinibacterium lentulum]|nr:sulfotransferase [Histidinibacterium lentulum]